DGERQEVDALARRLGGDDGGEHHGLAIGRHHSAVGLAGDLSGFKPEGTSAPVDLDRMNIEHMGLLSWVHERNGRPKKQKPCARWRDAARRTASASCDPAMVSGFRMAAILSLRSRAPAR